MQKELERIYYESCRVVTRAGKYMLDELGKVQSESIETKSINSLVSYVDKTAEEMLVDGLRKVLPESVFLTEEDTVENQEGEWQWIIDPLDGTTNFLHQLPCFAVSVALRYRQKTVLGIVYEPSRNECFYAWEGSGAFVNNRSIRVSSTTTLSESLIATGFPYYDYEQLSQYFKVLEHFILNTRGVRRFGSAAVDLAYVAAGRFDAFFEYSLQPWDVAAGAFIVQEAGGIVTDFSGENDYLFGQQMLAVNASLHANILDVVQREFN
ncbi:MAG: inositol monophosphatase family protein [Saprospiraceae bacterium]